MKYVKITKATDDVFYYVNTKKDEVGLGVIYFLKDWKKWVFEPDGATIYDSVCMNEIADFMKKL